MPWCFVKVIKMMVPFICTDSHKIKTIRKKWVVKCYMSDKFDYTTARVYSRHFEKKKYERNLKYELLG